VSAAIFRSLLRPTSINPRRLPRLPRPIPTSS